ncbi:PilZ domain-containing protein [Sphingomonas sp. M1-B02]|uniref:PilZ domain-containing protein n=1 Tax=Sphingomonas sp. M1-B02 TaxID=3114300 RepID=UPI00224082FE|nr:PilZ domain-containing protein [Sphingomonas sp. S6-11]UZK66081.1 PilZ domain-containing protein [Sphingomonas sp. S6-11]
MATRLSQFRSVAPASVDQRRDVRHRILVTRATVRRKDDPPVEATLRDLSIYGCRLACTSVHPAGERLWLSFRSDLPVAATVVWSDGTHIGCRFDAPIARSMMRALTLVIC